MGKAHPYRLKASSTSDHEGRPEDGNPLLIKVNKGTITIERMGELVSRYEVKAIISIMIEVKNSYGAPASLFLTTRMKHLEVSLAIGEDKKVRSQ